MRRESSLNKLALELPGIYSFEKFSDCIADIDVALSNVHRR